MKPVLRNGARLPAGDYEVIDTRPGGVRLYAMSLVLAAALLATSWALIENLAGGSSIEIPRLKVPSVAGLEVSVAEGRLENLGFVVDVKYQPNEEVSKGLVFDQQPLAGAKVEQGDPVLVLVSDGPLGLTVPSVIGQQEIEATGILLRNQLVPRIVDVFDETIRLGEVTGTEPDVGERVPRGGEVRLFVSKGPRPRTVPPIEDMSLALGLVDLGRAGLAIGDIDRTYVEGAEAGVILSTNPPPGTELPKDMPVGLVVSGAAPTTKVPYLVGLRRSSAESVALEEQVTLDVKTEFVPADDPTAGRVLFQGIPPATDVSPGTTVEIRVAAVRPQPERQQPQRTTSTTTQER